MIKFKIVKNNITKNIKSENNLIKLYYLTFKIVYKYLMVNLYFLNKNKFFYKSYFNKVEIIFIFLN